MESFLIIYINTSLYDTVALPEDLTIKHVSIHEDNTGVLNLADSTTSSHAQRYHHSIKTIRIHKVMVKGGMKQMQIKKIE